MSLLTTKLLLRQPKDLHAEKGHPRYTEKWSPERPNYLGGAEHDWPTFCLPCIAPIFFKSLGSIDQRWEHYPGHFLCWKHMYMSLGRGLSWAGVLTTKPGINMTSLKSNHHLMLLVKLLENLAFLLSPTNLQSHFLNKALLRQSNF